MTPDHPLLRFDRISWSVLGLTAFGAFLRFSGLDVQSLWYDELATWMNSQGGSAADVWNVMRANRHPPGHQIFMFYWQMAFGSSEAALRIPSAIAGALSIPAIYLLGRDMYSDRTGLIAATLLTVAWVPIRYSQEARAYALLMLLAIIGSWLLLKIIRGLCKQGKMPVAHSIAYVLLSVLACYLHYFGVVLVLFQASAYAAHHWNLPRALLRGLVLFIPVGLLYAPWLLETLNDLKSDRFWARPLEPVLTELNDVVEFLLGGTAGALLGYLLIGVMITKAVLSPPTESRCWYKGPTPFLFAWIIFPFAVAYAKSMITAPIMVPRYFLISLPAVYLLAAHALVRIVDNNRSLIVVTLSIAVACLTHLLLGVEYYTSVSKEQFREAVAEIVTHEAEYQGALLVGWNGANQPRREQPFNYYLRMLGSDRSLNTLAGKREDIIPFIRLLETHRPAYFWYAYGHKRPDPEFERALTSRFAIVRSITLYKAGAILFRTGFPGKPS